MMMIAANDSDIICGRGRGNYNHAGNKQLRALAREYMSQFMTCKTCVEKVKLFDVIVAQMRVEHSARFLKKCDGSWQELSNRQAQEKVRHIFSEAAADDAHANQTMGRTGPKKLTFAMKQTELLSCQVDLFSSDVLDSDDSAENLSQAGERIATPILKQMELLRMQKNIFERLLCCKPKRRSLSKDARHAASRAWI